MLKEPKSKTPVKTPSRKRGRSRLRPTQGHGNLVLSKNKVHQETAEMDTAVQSGPEPIQLKKKKPRSISIPDHLVNLGGGGVRGLELVESGEQVQGLPGDKVQKETAVPQNEEQVAPTENKTPEVLEPTPDTSELSVTENNTTEDVPETEESEPEMVLAEPTPALEPIAEPQPSPLPEEPSLEGANSEQEETEAETPVTASPPLQASNHEAHASPASQRTSRETVAHTPPKDTKSVGPEMAQEAANALDEAGGFEAAEVPTPELDSSTGSNLVKSIASLPPTQRIKGWGQVPGAMNVSQTSERQDAKAELPVIEQPTGLGRDDFETPEREKMPIERPEPMQVGGFGDPAPMDTSHTEPLTPVPGSEIPEVQEGEINSPFDFQKYLNLLPATDPDVDTKAGPRPGVDLTGNADPKQSDENQIEADAQVADQQYAADLETQKDFGENDMYPTLEPETLSADQEFGDPKPYSGGGVGELPSLTGEMIASYDPQLQEARSEQMEIEVVKTDEAQMEYDTRTEEERQKGLKEIEDETEATKLEQKSVQDQGREDVEESRMEWQTENEKVKEEYQDKSEIEREKIDKDIDKEVTKADEDVEKEYSKAEKDAAAEKEKSEKEADVKREEARKKKENRSWLQKIGDAIGDFFNWLKEQVIKIFDKLRELVNTIIEEAKKLVSELIDLARDLVVGLIETFAKALKTFISAALFAFPELAEKFNKAIDGFVEDTIAVIDKVADTLKKVANTILDFVASVYNVLLDVMQGLIMVSILVMKFVLTGDMEIFHGIANLVTAAKQSPDHFWDAVFEEMTGQDPSKPLEEIEFKSEKEKEDEMGGRMEELMEQMPALEEQMAEGEEPQSTAPDGALEMDMVPDETDEISPEMMAQLAAMADSKPQEMEGVENPLTMAELDQNAAQEGGAPPVAEEGEGYNQEAIGTDGGGFNFFGKTDKEKLAHYLDEMKPACEVKAEQESGDVAGQALPAEAKVGPLDKSTRREYIIDQLKRGLSNWWECNKVKIILILIGVLLGVAILTVITGGGFLAALPLIMKALAAIFLAVMIIKMEGHLKDYLIKSWDGETGGGAKSMAKALAVGAVELIFNVIFKVGGSLLKALKWAIKSIIKGVKYVLKAGMKLILKTTKAVTKLVMKSMKVAGKITRKGGKYTFTGLKKGFTKGVKSFKQLRNKLAGKFKFKKFKVVRKGMWFQILGQVNPWVLLATGKIKHIKEKNLKGGSKVGDKVKYKGKDGIVVGSKGAPKSGVKPKQYVKDLQKMNRTSRAKEFSKLNKMSSKSRSSALTGSGVPRNSMFRPNFFKALEKQGIKLSEKAKSLLAIHHIVPNFLKGGKELDELGKFITKDLKHNIDGVQSHFMPPTPQADRNPRHRLLNRHSNYQSVIFGYSSS